MKNVILTAKKDDVIFYYKKTNEDASKLYLKYDFSDSQKDATLISKEKAIEIENELEGLGSDGWDSFEQIFK